MRLLPVSACAALLLLALAAPGWAFDSDADGFDDAIDNCTAAPNPSQLDVDGDGYGNACDCDYNQDQVCGRPDVAILFACVGRVSAPGVGPDDDPSCTETDQDESGSVGLADLTLFIPRFRLAPGPAAQRRSVCDAARELLCPGLDVVAADVALADCLLRTDPRADPQSYDTASTLRAVTRVVRPAFESGPGPDPARLDSISELLDALGFGADGRDPLAWMATPPLSADGACLIPDDAVFERDAEELLRKKLLPQINAALRALPRIPDTWSDVCAIQRVDVTMELEIDHSDLLLAEAALLAGRGMIRLLGAWELDFDLADGCRAIYEGGFGGIERLLADHPELLEPDLARSEAARMAGEDLRAALRVFVEALDSLEAESDEQLDDLFSFDPAFLPPEREAAFRDLLARIDASFDAPTLFPEAELCGEPPIEIGRLFDGLDLRGLAPPFSGNVPVLTELPDPFLGGVVSQPWSVEELLCSVDTQPPVLENEPPLGRQVINPAQVTLRVQDLPDPTGSVSGLDPDSIRVEIRFFENAGRSCSGEINDVPVLSHTDVTALFGRSLGSDGSVLLSASVSVIPNPLPSRGCGVSLRVFSADRGGNETVGFDFFNAVTSGALIEVEPPSNTELSTPFALSVRFTAPFSDIDLETLQVRLLASTCSDVSISGTLLGAIPFLGTYVTSLLSESIGMNPPSRTLSAPVAVSGSPCSLVFLAEVFSPGSSDSREEAFTYVVHP